jgi:trigger factor
VNIVQENIDALNATLKINISKEDYLPKVEEALKNYRKNVNLNGFRKGMVPMGIVKKMYGDAVLFEEMNKLVGEATTKHFEEGKVEILGRPIQKDTNLDVNINDPKDIVLEYEIGLAPAVDLSKIEKLKVTQQTIEVSDQDVEKEMDALRMRNGKVTNPSKVADEKDLIYVDLVEMDDDKEKEGGYSTASVLSLETIKDKKLKAKIEKLEVGNSIEVDIFKDFDKDAEGIKKNILNLKDGVAPEGMSEDFKLTLTKIHHLDKADLDQEFLDKTFGPGKVNSEEEARAELKKEIQQYFNQMAVRKNKDAFVNTITDALNLSLPDEFLKKWLKQSNEKPITDDQLNSEYGGFAQDLKWTIISNKLRAENNLEPEMEEVKEFSRNIIRDQMAKFNTTGNEIGEETIEMFNNQMFAKEEHVKKSYESVVEQKLFSFIESKLIVNKETVTLEDFLKKNN